MAALLGLANVPAPIAVSQSDIARFVARSCPPGEDREELQRRTRAIFSRGGIATRHTVLADFSSANPSFFRPDRVPSTGERMRAFEQHSVELAAAAAERALIDAGLDARAITHLVVTTCTGFFAPGPDIALIERLGLPRSVRRTIVGFMGCYAGFTAMRLAAETVRAEPDARVLVVSVELCSLHFQPPATVESIVASSLFADGASAAIFGRGGERELIGWRSFIAPGTEREMSWRIGDRGFEMTLAAEVPSSLAKHARPFLDGLLASARVTRDRSLAFAIHPGGRRILEAIAAALELDDGQMEASRSVLRDFGNMSSAAIMFVLERELLRRDDPRSIVLLGFGPGLTMEGAVLRV